ncbi:hypothetical protein GGF32_005152 [Allomyces javanicus]|nr:hypothetical protein GGF32_005152 [Allomyces javanicus]
MPPPSTTPLVTTFSGVSGALRTEITAGNPYGKIVYPNSLEVIMAVTAIFATPTSNPIPTATGIVMIRGDPGSQAVWAQRSAILLAILVAAGLAISVVRRRLRRLKEHPLARRERHLLKADRRMLQTTTSIVVDTLPRYDTTEQEHATGGGLRARASALDEHIVVPAATSVAATADAAFAHGTGWREYGRCGGWCGRAARVAVEQ